MCFLTNSSMQNVVVRQGDPYKKTCEELPELVQQN
jgi:hypothetical protein